MFDRAGFGIAIIDLDGRFVDANPAYVGLTGYSLDELREMNYLALTHPDDRDLNRSGLAALLRGEIESFDLEKRYITSDGRTVWIRGKVTRIGGDDEPVHVVGTFEDNTAAKAAEREVVRLSNEVERTTDQLRLTFESMSDAVYVVDHAWRFTYLNSHAERLLRRGADDLRGKEIWSEFPDAIDTPLHATYHRAVEAGTSQELDEFHFAPLESWFRVAAFPSDQGLTVYFDDITDEREARLAISRQAALLDEATDAIIVRRRDHIITYWNRSAERLYGWPASEAVGCDIRTLLHDNVARFDEANAELLARGSWTGEFVLRSRTGDRIIVAARWTLIRDHDTDHDVVLAVNTDVTDQRRTELQLVRAQRLESIGTLAGGVAHDLNNTLAPILLASEMLHEEEDDADRGELISMILNSARRGADLVSQLLSFARGVDGDREPVDVAELLHAVYSIVRETFPKDIVVRTEVQAGLESVTGDRTQLQQVLLNLAVNARDAMPDGGTITLSASTVELDGQYLVAADGASPGRYVLIEVEDDGHGMAADVLDRVFEPFFTTKQPGSGTGLGLSMSAGIVQSHGGFLRAYSEIGSGSRFRVYLPSASHPAAPSDPSPSVAAPLRGTGETVLVVDDEDAIRSTTRRTLEHAGYLVVEAANGAAAVAAFARFQEQIDVVLIDMMMPVMDGPSAIHALRSLDPHARIVAASGLHGNGKTTRAANAGVRHFLPKPYTSAGLLQAIAEALAD